MQATTTSVEALTNRTRSFKFPIRRGPASDSVLDLWWKDARAFTRKRPLPSSFSNNDNPLFDDRSFRQIEADRQKELQPLSPRDSPATQRRLNRSRKLREKRVRLHLRPSTTDSLLSPCSITDDDPQLYMPPEAIAKAITDAISQNNRRRQRYGEAAEDSLARHTPPEVRQNYADQMLRLYKDLQGGDLDEMEDVEQQSSNSSRGFMSASPADNNLNTTMNSVTPENSSHILPTSVVVNAPVYSHSSASSENCHSVGEIGLRTPTHKASAFNPFSSPQLATPNKRLTVSNQGPAKFRKRKRNTEPDTEEPSISKSPLTSKTTSTRKRRARSQILTQPPVTHSPVSQSTLPPLPQPQQLGTALLSVTDHNGVKRLVRRCSRLSRQPQEQLGLVLFSITDHNGITRSVRRCSRLH